MSRHQAPRFHAYFERVEGRRVMVLPRRDWEQLSQLREGDIAEIDLSTTPVAAVLQADRVEAVVALRESNTEVVVEVYRKDPKDWPTPINLDRYRVWERLPRHRDYADMVNFASTEDNRNMRGFLADHVFLVKDLVTRGHWLHDLPPRIKAVVGHKSSPARTATARAGGGCGRRPRAARGTRLRPARRP
jgi:hypothetical protein